MTPKFRVGDILVFKPYDTCDRFYLSARVLEVTEKAYTFKWTSSDPKKPEPADNSSANEWDFYNAHAQMQALRIDREAIHECVDYDS